LLVEPGLEPPPGRCLCSPSREKQHLPVGRRRLKEQADLTLGPEPEVAYLDAIDGDFFVTPVTEERADHGEIGNCGLRMLSVLVRHHGRRFRFVIFARCRIELQKWFPRR